MPTYSAMSTVSFYVRAVTNGNKVAYRQISVRITECGSEVVTSNFPYYWNITVPFSSGLYKTRVIDKHALAELFSSTVSLATCPLGDVQLQPYSHDALLTRNRGQLVHRGTQYGPDLSTQVYMTKGNYIEIDTNSFSAERDYFVDLAVTSSAGYVAYFDSNQNHKTTHSR